MSAHYVYRIYDKTGRLIYVGRTRNLVQRLRTHGYNAWWYDQAAKAVAKVYPSKVAACAAEMEAVAQEMPRWNISGKWITNDSWTREDFVDYVTALLNSVEAGHGTERRADRARQLYRSRTGRAFPAELPHLLEAHTAVSA